MHLYGLIIGVCLTILINYFYKHNSIIPTKQLDKFTFFLLFFAVIGARLYHVFDYHQYYLQHPLQIFNLPAGGLGIFGAILFGLSYIFIYSQHNHLNFIKILDQFTPVLPLSQSIGRWANLINQEGWGSQTNSFLGQLFLPKGFHPTWFYESILNLFLFIYIYFQQKSKSKTSPTIIYLFNYGLIRFVVEFFRTDTWQIHSLKIGQLLSLLFILTSLFLIKSSKKLKTKPQD
ncbi:prolipoprotein diacylglyceryl transferase [Candidatus Shapirobacteria bacterium]|nr:MAG: prolipoprotein diacylglyceryl transferase [Candidatus Shapirobacteria bacterium]